MKIYNQFYLEKKKWKNNCLISYNSFNLKIIKIPNAFF